jgi:hypothetical protein
MDEQSEQTLPQLKNMKLSKDEATHLKEYRRLEELERQKGIKFFECIGDEPITDNTIDGIDSKRKLMIDDKNNQMRDEDCHRYKMEIDTDKVVVDTDLNLVEKPKWDAFENNHFAMRRRLVNIFLKVANRQII